MVSNIHRLAFMAGKSALVLRKAEINESGPVYVKIIGRKSGIIRWLFAILGIDTTFTFTVYERRIEVTEGTLSGNLTSVYPLASISTCGFGYLKPFHYFVLAVICLIASVVCLIQSLDNPFGDGIYGAVSIVTLVLVLVFILLYYLRKTLYIFAISNSGAGAYLFAKRSIIEGVKLSKEDAGGIAAIITRLVEINQRKDAAQNVTKRIPFSVELDHDQIPATDIIFDCPHCGKSLSIDRKGAGLAILCTTCHQRITVPTLKA